MKNRIEKDKSPLLPVAICINNILEIMYDLIIKMKDNTRSLMDSSEYLLICSTEFHDSADMVTSIAKNSLSASRDLSHSINDSFSSLKKNVEILEDVWVKIDNLTGTINESISDIN